MGLKPRDKERPTGEKLLKYTSIAMNRGFTAVESNTLARMLIDSDNRLPLSGYSVADRALYTRFTSL